MPTNFEAIEIFALLGIPFRLYGRLPLAVRYVWNALSGNLRAHPGYAVARWGQRAPWRLWLLFDLEELEKIEEIINHGSDDIVLQFRRNQLEAMQMVSIVGALVCGVAISAVGLPAMDSTTYYARALLFISMMMSLIATFFTCMQQRTYGFIEQPAAIRAWLSNGLRYTDRKGRDNIYQSSLVSHELLQAPFELLCISITSFLGGLTVHLGSAVTLHLNLGSENERPGNIGTILVVALGSAFALSMMGQLLAAKDVEVRRCRKINFEHFDTDLDIMGPAQSRVSAAPVVPIPTKGGGATTTTTMVLDSEEPLDRSADLTGKNATDRLVKALANAAAAHRLCASADAEVAQCYEAIASASSSKLSRS